MIPLLPCCYELERSLFAMVNPDQEIPRLRELMPASGWMKTRIRSNQAQPQVIATESRRPWKQTYPISINFDLWGRLSIPERDLLFLQQIGWVTGTNPFKLDVPRGVAIAGVAATLFETFQGNAVGMLMAGGVTAIAATRVWRDSRGPSDAITADETAIQVAARRGYSRAEAAQHLASAIETVARIEGRRSMSFNDVLRCQNLNAIAGPPIPVSGGRRR
ncbi:MAG: DUF3318 domain-containing protein [Cyanobacteria bacterium J06639_16]